MTQESDCSLERINMQKVGQVLQLIVSISHGPHEGYGVLCAAIYQLNALMDEPASIDTLADEVAHSLRTMTSGTQQ
jgi:hypothetical protein